MFGPGWRWLEVMMRRSSGSPEVSPTSTPSIPHYVVDNVNKFLIYLSTDFKRGGKLRKTKYLPRHDTLSHRQIKKLRSPRINSSNMTLSQIIQ